MKKVEKKKVDTKKKVETKKEVDTKKKVEKKKVETNPNFSHIKQFLLNREKKATDKKLEKEPSRLI